MGNIIDDVMNPNNSRFASSNGAQQKKFKFQVYYRMLRELALNRYKWDGVPDEIDHQFIEKMLMYNSNCIFSYDSDFGYIALPGTPTAAIDLYGRPLAYTVFSINQRFNKVLSTDDCVVIWPNMLRRSDLDVIEMYSMILSEVSQTIDINTLQLRNPIVMSGPRRQQKTMQKMLEQVEGGAFSYIENDAMTDNIEVKAFQTEMHPDNLVKTQLYKQKAWNECMTYLGINNANQDKAERLVVDEVSANDSQVVTYRLSGIKARKMACEQINDMYGLNMSVEWNSDIDAMADMQVFNEINEGDDGEDKKEGDSGGEDDPAIA